MNISKKRQRVLHLLAQGGWLQLEKDDRGKIAAVQCYTRDGWVFAQCEVEDFKALKHRRLIRSVRGEPYRITRDGLDIVTARLDQR